MKNTFRGSEPSNLVSIGSRVKLRPGSNSSLVRKSPEASGASRTRAPRVHFHLSFADRGDAGIYMSLIVGQIANQPLLDEIAQISFYGSKRQLLLSTEENRDEHEENNMCSKELIKQNDNAFVKIIVHRILITKTTVRVNRC